MFLPIRPIPEAAVHVALIQQPPQENPFLQNSARVTHLLNPRLCTSILPAATTVIGFVGGATTSALIAVKTNSLLVVAAGTFGGSALGAVLGGVIGTVAAKMSDQINDWCNIPPNQNEENREMQEV